MISRNILINGAKRIKGINGIKGYTNILTFNSNLKSNQHNLNNRFHYKSFSDVCSPSNKSSKELGQNFNISLSKDTSGNRTIFFDFQSTTPVDPRVLDAMLPYLTVRYGNPHSKSHEYGWEADQAVEKAREVYYQFIYLIFYLEYSQSDRRR
jgi:hypothetical protein